MYDLNDEQMEALSAASPVLVNAAAGSGKTRCLISKIRQLLDTGAASPQQILAITFTNKAAKEMRERLKPFCPTVAEMQISTIHSMCVRIIRTFLHHTPLKNPFSIYDDSDQIAVVKTIMKARKIEEDPWNLLAAISRAKGGQTTDTLDGDTRTVYDSYQTILKANNACDFDDLLVYALTCVHQPDCQKHYSNLWRHILVDEFQDTSTVQYKIVTALYNPLITKTMFVVGDQNQCVIKGTLIGDQSVETVLEGDFVPTALGRGKSANRMVSKTYKKMVVNKPVVTLETTTGKMLTLTNEHIVFAGYTGKEEKNTRFFTYLMYKEDLGYRVGVTSIIRGRGKKNNPGLGFKSRLNQERADHLWLLGTYETKAEALYHEQLYSVKYGIPTWVFYSRKGMTYQDSNIAKLFKSLDTESSAKALLRDLGLFFNKPHHIPKCMNVKRRRNFSIKICADIREGRHRYSLMGSDLKDAEILKTLGLIARPSRDKRGYRIEGVSPSIKHILDIVEKISSVLQINVIESGNFTNYSLPMIPASHMLSGMSCFVESSNGTITTDTIKSVKRHFYSGEVFDLDMDHFHNYIANGVVVHNSIYGWRQAQPENMQTFVDTYKANIRYLTYNYRSASGIINFANGFLQYGKAMVAKSSNTGSVSVSRFDSQEDEANRIADAISRSTNYEETAILYRTNARSILFEKAFACRRIPYKVVGDIPFYKRKIVKDLLGYCKAAANKDDLQSLCRIVNVPKRGFGETRQERLMKEGRGYLESEAGESEQLQEFLDTLNSIKGKRPVDAITTILDRTKYRALLEKESDISMLDAFLNIASSFNSVEEMILASTFLEEDSGKGVRLMTAHASKGLEFDCVFVVGVEEGIWPHKMSLDTAEESRLYYVACTRARKYLNVSYSKSKLLRGANIEVRPSYLLIESQKLVL